MNSTQLKVVIPTGLALFAMFFGAGNMIFPLKIGSIAGQHVWIGLLAFLITGVGVPFLGLFAASLYDGDYWNFFNRLGKVLSFIVVTFLIMIIGPLFAAPRTETVAFGSLAPMLPSLFQDAYVFNFIYFALVALVVARQSRVVDIIGWLLSPIKILTFTILIISALWLASPLMTVETSAAEIFSMSLITGYGTMDLLASLFFCTVAYRNIVAKCAEAGMYSQKNVIKMTLMSCIIGAVLICIVYIGFIFAAATHAENLQNVPTGELLNALSFSMWGPYGALFIGICVAVSCLTTASALTEVTTEYIHETVLRRRVPRSVCLSVILVVMYCIAIIGFDGIMKIATPVLEILYPLLIVLCIVNIIWKLMHPTVDQETSQP